eukprot:TRINITY_DN32900_c0_g1_i1.p1 TRINITY_DN32900_c0_g1~~TRINITY_DN32900_c0_g1_i1.p1  ORF type:complete len:600 (+),score=118.92 TRINITY_DN32900_c0_g1_i1:176-1975(+)
MVVAKKEQTGNADAATTSSPNREPRISDPPVTTRVTWATDGSTPHGNSVSGKPEAAKGSQPSSTASSREERARLRGRLAAGNQYSEACALAELPPPASVPGEPQSDPDRPEELPEIKQPLRHMLGGASDSAAAAPSVGGEGAQATQGLLADGSYADNAVFVNVYDLGDATIVRQLNTGGALMKMGGAFHAGVEVYSDEWCYGFAIDEPNCTKRLTGIGLVVPRAHPDHTYRGTVYMGCTAFDAKAVSNLLAAMAPEWPGCEYDILHRNCLTFCHVLCKKLGVQSLPSWVDRGARTIGMLDWSIRSTMQGMRMAFNTLTFQSLREEANADVAASSAKAGQGGCLPIALAGASSSPSASPKAGAGGTSREQSPASASRRPPRRTESIDSIGTFMQGRETFEVGTPVFYLGEPRLLDEGGLLHFGTAGVVRSHQSGTGLFRQRLEVLFVTQCEQALWLPSTELCTEDPSWPIAPGGWKVGDRCYWQDQRQRFPSGSLVVYGLQGRVTGKGSVAENVMVLFDGNEEAVEVRLTSLSARQPTSCQGLKSSDQVECCEGEEAPQTWRRPKLRPPEQQSDNMGLFTVFCGGNHPRGLECGDFRLNT